MKRVPSAIWILTAFIAGVVTTSAVAGVHQRGAVPDATVVSPDHYKVEFENDYVRVIRVHFAAHANGAMHSHPAPGGALVHLTAEHAQLVLPDGTTREVSYPAGAVHWSPGAAHSEENLSDKPFESIRVDVKRCVP